MKIDLKSFKETTPRLHPTNVSSEIAVDPDQMVKASFFVTLSEEMPGFQPVKSPRSCRDLLYEETCFEVFISQDESYLEWNVATNGDWHGYFYRKYRESGVFDVSGFQPLAFEVNVLENRLQSSMVFSLRSLENLMIVNTRQVSVQCCFIYRNDFGVSYWAPRHCHKDKPDFHDLRGFLKYN